MAGATQERTLWGVGSSAMFGHDCLMLHAFLLLPCHRPTPGMRLADHLVGLEEQGRGNAQAQFLRGLEVDDQLKLHGLLHGQVRRLRPAQELVDVECGRWYRSMMFAP